METITTVARKIKKEQMYSRADLEDAFYELSKHEDHKDYSICPLTIAQLTEAVFNKINLKTK